jgi:hypothetical protein
MALHGFKAKIGKLGVQKDASKGMRGGKLLFYRLSRQSLMSVPHSQLKSFLTEVV